MRSSLFVVLLLSAVAICESKADDTIGPHAGITYATTALNWSQTLNQALAAGSQATVTLTPCPVGADTTSGAGYQVLLSGRGGRETVRVVAGSCRAGLASGTIAFTPYFSYPAGSKVGSASSGLQESINAACGVDPMYYKNGHCNVTVPATGPLIGTVQAANTYSVDGSIYLHTSHTVLSGYGAVLDCIGRGPCLQIGDLASSNHAANNSVQGLSFRTPVDYSKEPAYAGVAITETQRSGHVATITTASAHGFRPGDMITILFTDNSAYWGDAIVCGPPGCNAPTANTFQYQHQGGDIARQATPGVVALAYEAVLDNGINTHLQDISYDLGGEAGHFNNFFDLWDDENVTIDHFNNNAINLNANANWTGSFVFSGGNPPGNPPGTAGQQVAAVITLRDSTITANYSNGLTVYNSNGIYIENTVIQAVGPWQVYSANSTGNYQGAYLKNIYSESGAQMNPLSPARSPFPGTGVAGLIAGPSSAAASFTIAGSGGIQGWFSSGGSGPITYSYFVVAKDNTTKTQTSPMQILNYRSTGSDSITVRWPRVANGTDVITYDLIRGATPLEVGSSYPYGGGCNGGSASACGSVATKLPQCAGLVCSYTDSGSAVTANYAIPPGDYVGNLIFWPGSIVAVNRSVMVRSEQGNVVGVGLVGNPVQIATECTGYGVASPGGYTSCLASITTANNSVPNQSATLMTDGTAAGGGMPLSKGRLNFSTSPWSALQPHHFITLVDSQPALTRSTTGYRPPGSADDTWIGTDVASSGVRLNRGQLAFGAPVSITNYIHQTGDGAHANWLERLTSAQKTFAVPVKIDEGNSFTLGNGSALSQMKIYSVSVPASRIPPQSCADVVGKVAGLTSSDQITGISPPGKLGNLSLNGYAAAADVITLHFCNPSSAEAVAPGGAYSFLAIR